MCYPSLIRNYTQIHKTTDAGLQPTQQQQHKNKGQESRDKFSILQRAPLKDQQRIILEHV